MFNCVRSTRFSHFERTPTAVGVLLMVAGLGIALPTQASATVPAITSGDTATAVVGSVFSPFTVTTTGMPVPSIKHKGKLPQGLTLTDNHDGTADLSGTPSSTTGGVYPRPSGGVYDITIVATFGSGMTKQIVTQAFTLIVDQAPTIKSKGTKRARVGVSFSFTVKSIGYPRATISESGPLPNGITFTNNGNGTATFTGTPGNGSAGSYPTSINASNGVGSPASQDFTLTVRS